MKLLFIGDVVGRPGRRAVRALLPVLKERHGLDVIIANGENSAGGAGITPETAAELFEAGVDVITSGDHLWDHKAVMELLANEPRFIRPANYPAGTPGHGWYVLHKDALPPLAVVNLQGRTFMQALENPFTVARGLVRALQGETRMIFVDMHAEATSEKVALARMLDGQVTAVVGTHTHVQTADEQVFPGGTGFLCDAGFTGPHTGVIGRMSEPIIERFLTNMPQRFDVASDNVLLQGAVIDIDETTVHARSVRRISEPLPPG